MKVYSIVFVVLVFAVGVSAQDSPPHQHSVPANMIDGSKTPNQIPTARLTGFCSSPSH